MTRPGASARGEFRLETHRLARFARGIGIVLVVIGHTLGGLIDSPIGAGLGTFRALFADLHLPYAAVLPAVGTDGAAPVGAGTGPFLRGLLPSVVWPYSCGRWCSTRSSLRWVLR